MPKSALSDRFPTIDKIVVGEKKKRFESISKHLVQAERAANALDWFSNYGTLVEGGRGLTDIYRMNIEVVAASCVHASDAQQYLKAAFEPYRKQILIDAIQMAQADMHALDVFK